MTTASDEAALAASVAIRHVDHVTLANGIVLRLRPVSPATVRSASAHLKRPEPPIVLIPEKGREEANPSDPGYLAALRQWEQDIAEAGLTVALVLGTEVESIPDGIHKYEDEAWISEILAAQELVSGAPVPVIRREGKGRYLDWLRKYAISTHTDLFTLTQLLTLGVGLTDAEVQAAAESFRRIYAGAPLVDSAPLEPAAVGGVGGTDAARNGA